jgi:hypothetical protein
MLKTAKMYCTRHQLNTLQRTARRLSRRRLPRKPLLALLLTTLLIYMLLKGTAEDEPGPESPRLQRAREAFVRNDQDDFINTETYLSQAERFRQIKEHYQAGSSSAAMQFKVRSMSNSQPPRLQSLNKAEYLILEYTKFWGKTKFCHVANR